MVSRHSKNSNGPRFQIGKLGTFQANTPITKQSESVMMPHRTNLFPGWLLKISQNEYTVSSAIPIVRIVAAPPIIPNISEIFSQSPEKSPYRTRVRLTRRKTELLGS
jgi:hypothetical protein